MSRGIKIKLNPIGITYDVYTGTTSGSTTGITCNDITSECDITIPDSYNDNTIWVKCVTNSCDDQLFEMYIGDPPS